MMLQNLQPWANSTCPRIPTPRINPRPNDRQITSHLVAELVPHDLANEVAQAQDKHPKGYDKGNGVKMPWLPRWDICTGLANVNIHEIWRSWGTWLWHFFCMSSLSFSKGLSKASGALGGQALWENPYRIVNSQASVTSLKLASKMSRTLASSAKPPERKPLPTAFKVYLSTRSSWLTGRPTVPLY